MTTNIYILSCPLSGEVMYVGKANDVHRRLRDHMCDWRGVEYAKVLWLRGLQRKGLKPILDVVDVVEMEDWMYWERWWIEYLTSLGVKLTNSHKGGNGLSRANNTTFKKKTHEHN